jgi:hypothetical protein
MKLLRGKITNMAAALAAMLVFGSTAAHAITAKDLCSYAPAAQVQALLGAKASETETSGPEPDEDRHNAIATACQFNLNGRAVVVYLVEFASLDEAKDSVQHEFKAAASDKSATVSPVASSGLGDEAYQAKSSGALMYIARKGTKVFAAGVIGISISPAEMAPPLLAIATSVAAHL